MSKILIASLVTLSLAAAFAPGVAAFTCDDIPAIDLDGRVYLDIRHLADSEALYSIWIFAESGVSPGLQRGGSQVAFAATGAQDIANEIGETDPDCVLSPWSDHLIL